MRLPKCLKCVCFLTVLALMYIHMQMQIIDLAYQGKDRETEIRQLLEENGNETYTILNLKSANHIGNKMLTEDSDLHFVDPVDVIQVSLDDESDSTESEHIVTARNENSIFSFLSFKAH